MMDNAPRRLPDEPALTRQTATLTAVAMVAFAANTLLCRIALANELVDPGSFMFVRTVSGGIMLLAIVLPRWRGGRRAPVDFRAAAALALYMVGFSFAYVSVGAGTGAVIFFGVVQLTMLAAALRAGERLSVRGWIGLAGAAGGLVYLVSPGITAPDPLGALLMGTGGLAWGIYSLLGKGAADPVEATANNFLYAIPLVGGTAILFVAGAHVSLTGVLLAAASGAIASGLDYVIWYAALKGLSSTRAATVQLSVPVLSAVGGLLLIDEKLTLRLLVGGAATLCGIAIVLAQRDRSALEPSERTQRGV
jgi:drug/metabolite transporter (DMT)-like permease